MKGVIQEYQETQRTAEVSEKKQAFLQDFKEMITEAIKALKSDTEWAELDLSKYFDTLNHEILMNLLRRNEKFLGFALGRNGNGIYVRAHPKSWKKFKSKLKGLSSRKSVQAIKPSLVVSDVFKPNIPVVCHRSIVDTVRSHR